MQGVGAEAQHYQLVLGALRSLSVYVGVPEWIVHCQPLGLGSGQERVITCHVDDSLSCHPFLQHFLQPEATGQMDSIEAAQGVFLAQLSAVVHDDPACGQEIILHQDVPPELAP